MTLHYVQIPKDTKAQASSANPQAVRTAKQRKCFCIHALFVAREIQHMEDKRFGLLL